MTITVSAGVTDSGLKISSGDPLLVLSGGTVEDSAVLSGGSATLSSGALALGLTISKGGTLLGAGNVESADVNGAVSGVALTDSGTMTLHSGAVASGVKVDEGATLVVSAQASAEATLVSGGALSVAGSESGAIVESDGDEVVSSGAVAAGDVVRSGGFLDLVAGGTASGDRVQSGGNFYSDGGVLSQSVAIGTVTTTTVVSGVTVSSGGAIQFAEATVLSGVTLNLAADAGLESLVISKGGAVTGDGYLYESAFGAAEEDAAVVAGSIDGVTAGGVSIELLSGGTASGLAIYNPDDVELAELQIDSGASATGTTVGAGAAESVGAGALASATVLVSGAEYVEGVSDRSILSGGTAYVSSGGIAVDSIVSANGGIYVGAQGIAHKSVVFSGGAVVVESGGVTSGDRLVSSGFEWVSSGGAIDAITIEGGSAFIYAGGVVSGATLLSGGGEEIDSGGVGSNATVEAGARLTVSSGGLVASAIVESGGLLLLADGRASGATVASGGVLGLGATVTSDLTAGAVTSTTVISGVTASKGAIVEVVSAAVRSGATLTLLSGALGENLTVSKGAEVVGAGELAGETDVSGVVSGLTIAGFLELAKGAIGSALKVGASAQVTVAAGAQLFGLTAQSGALIDVSGSTTGLAIGSSVEVDVSSGGTALSAIVQSGGLLRLAGGAASGTRVESGGQLEIADRVSGTVIAGTVTATTELAGLTLSSGAVVTLDNAEVTKGATVSFGAKAVVSGLVIDAGGSVVGPGDLQGETYDSGVISGATLDGVGGGAGVFAGGRVSDVSVDLGSDLSVGSGAVASATTLRGNMDVGGVASGTAVLSGGLEFVDELGSDIAATIRSGGVIDVGFLGTATSLTVLAGGVVSGGGDLWGVDRIAGLASGVALTAGADVEIASGGRGSALDVSDPDGSAPPSELAVEAGGVVVADTVSFRGLEVIKSGGVASATTVLSGGSESVTSGGEAIRLVVSSAGSATISAGGIVNGASLASGGLLIDNGELRNTSSGTLAGTLSGSGIVVEAGSGVLLLAGAGTAFGGQLAIEGGAAELAKAGAIGSGGVEFVEPATGSAVLRLDAADAPKAGGTFANALSNFSGANEQIDLAGLAFVSGASATLTGSTLVLSDGGKTFDFDVAGKAAAGYTVTSDGRGGTQITAAAADPAVARFSQAAAAFAPTDAAKTALVSSTGSLGQTPFAQTGAGHHG